MRNNIAKRIQRLNRQRRTNFEPTQGRGQIQTIEERCECLQYQNLITKVIVDCNPLISATPLMNLNILLVEDSLAKRLFYSIKPQFSDILLWWLKSIINIHGTKSKPKSCSHQPSKVYTLDILFTPYLLAFENLILNYLILVSNLYIYIFFSFFLDIDKSSSQSLATFYFIFSCIFFSTSRWNFIS